ncbi:MAG: hypothetical protein JSU08_08790 [Acidobacteria bacterium]|nr:hypothetical protein [Acidobacteriota bacterium]
MHLDLLDILRCPFCGGRLNLVTSLFHRTSDDTISDGVIGCECCVFPVVDGIPVMHLQGSAVAAREAIEAEAPDRALLAMVGAENDKAAEAFTEAAASATSTYRDIVNSLGDGFEGGYFLYRFSDPTYVVADAVVRAVAGTVLAGGGRALDVCGGSGHLTRALVPLSTPAPVMADLFYTKLWLARRYTAPGAVPVCCDANIPLPFARGAFDYAMCSDALMFVWMKRLVVGEMLRAVDGSPRATVLVNHAHNQLVWSPSHGNTLTVSGYRQLFQPAVPRAFGESALLEEIVQSGRIDLARVDSEAQLSQDAAFTLIGTKVEEVFRSHAVPPPQQYSGEWSINPLYQVDRDAGQLRLTFRFPSDDYEYEFGACRRYLPQSATVDAAALAALQAGTPQPALDDLIRRRVIVSLPQRYV